MDSAHLAPELLGDYAEGLLDPAARRAADAHLEACGECRRALEAAREYFAEMAGLEPFNAPERFLTRVHGRIARRSPWKRALAVLSSPRFLPVPLAGLAAALVGVYLVLAPQLRQETPPTVALAEPRPAAEPPAVGLAEAPASAREEAAGPEAEADDGPSAGSGVESRTKAKATAAAPPAAPSRLAEAGRSARESGREAGAAESDREVAAYSRQPSAPAGKKALGNAMAPPPATTPLPWAPEDYTLRRKADGAGAPAEAGSGSGADGFADGLAQLGARLLRSEGGAFARYEVELPAARIPDLEAFLRGYGELIPSPRPRPGLEKAATRRLVLRVERAP